MFFIFPLQTTKRKGDEIIMTNNPIRTEKGFTLVEVIAAVILIGIILISFIGIFVQTTKTRVASEQLVDATYYAQQEMEKIYLLSQLDFSLIDSGMKDNGYTKEIDARPINYDTSKTTTYKNSDTYDYTIYVTFKEKIDGQPKLNGVVVEVYEEQNGSLVRKSIMENIYIWGRSNP